MKTKNAPAGLSWKYALLILIAFAVLFSGGFASGAATVWFLGPQLRTALGHIKSAPSKGEQEISWDKEVALLQEIWAILQREYIDPQALNAQKMVYGAAAGFVAAIGDPHTAFVEPLSTAILNEDMQGSFEGIGATVDMVDGQLVIVRPLPNSPAEKAGLRAGDIILEVDGTPLKGKTIMEAVSLIRGPQGTVVRLLVKREGVKEPFIVPVTRAKVELPILESKMLPERIAYLRLTEFNAVSAKKVHAALKELLAQDPAGLVFDLRNNPGGFLQMSIEVASEFLPQGTLIVKEKERGKPFKEYRVRKEGLATEIPLVVLVNGGSASASEIVAGAIQVNGRGTLIGEKTFGKGSVQNTHKLEDGSSLRVTIARWYLPNGNNLDGQGITPDIQVPMTPKDASAGRDPQLDRAVDYLLHGAK